MGILRKLSSDRRPSTAFHTQEQSSLLKLPGEIRQYIYELVLSQRFIDLYLTKYSWKRRTRGPLACRCLHLEDTQRLPDHHPKIPQRHATHRADFVFPPVKRRPSFQWGHDPSKELTPALVLTCRKIFLESAHLLYSANVFQILDPNVLLSLPRRLTLPSVDNIHTIHMHFIATGSWNPAYHTCAKDVIKLWSKVWTCLSVLRGLEELFFRLWDPYTLIHTEEFRVGHFHAQRVLAPLRLVTRPKSFRFMLALPERVDPATLVVPGTSCQVIRTMNLHQEAAFGADTWLQELENQQTLADDEGQQILNEALGRPTF